MDNLTASLSFFEFLKYLFPRARYEAADFIGTHKCTFPLGAVVFTNIRIGMPASQCLKFRVVFR